MDTDEGKELIEKWEDGIDPATATKAELQEYVTTKMYQYILYKKSDDNLWDLFQDDFKNFDNTAYSLISHMLIQNLRTQLCYSSVYIEQNHRNLTITQSFINLAQEETKSIWNEADIVNNGPIRTDLLQGPIISVYLTLDGTGYKGTRRSQSRNQAVHPPPSNQGYPPLPPLPPPVLLPNPNYYQSIPTVSAGKLIGEVAKIYSEVQKYNGTNGSFDYKLTIFLDICQHIELPEEALARAFPTILKGLVQDHFYNNQLSQYTYKEACTNIRSFFEGPGFHYRNLDKWNATTLTTITAKDPEKTTFELVQMLINDLYKLQYGLAPALQSTEFLYNKIITSCQGSPACRYAVSDPPDDLGQLINKLQSSITTYEKE
jgi:hypothetical protein